MNEVLVKELLSQGSFFRLNKALIRGVGLNEAAVLSILFEYYSTMKEKYNIDCFYVVAEDLQKELNLGRKPIDSAIANLVKHSLIEVKLKGLPAKRHFILHFDVIEKYIANYSDQNERARLSKTDKQDCPKGTNYNKEIDNNIPNSPIINNSPISPIIEERNIEINNISKKKEKKKELDFSFLDSPIAVLYKNAMLEWFEYKREIGDMYKTQKGIEGALEDLRKACGNMPQHAQEIVDYCISHEWKGIYKPKDLNNGQSDEQQRSSEFRECLRQRYGQYM